MPPPSISSNDRLDDAPSPAQMTTDISPRGDGSLQCYFMNLSEEMIAGVLRSLDPLDLIHCAQASRLLNMLAVQAVLDQQSLWRPESVCNIMISSCTIRPPDVLSALLISIHVKKMAYVSFDLTRIGAYSDLGTPLVRLKRLINRLESVNDVAFHFTYTVVDSSRTMSDKELKRLCQSFGDLLTALTLKSCATIQFANLHTSTLGKTYTFRRGIKSSPQPTLLTQFKGYLKNNKEGGPPKPKPLEDDIRYGRSGRLARARMIHVLASPSALEFSKLERFDTASINIFRPPFSVWAFSMLHSSRITHFSVGFKDLPEDKEETQYLLDRLSAALPDIILLTIYSVTPKHVPEILTWLNFFPKIGTLSLPLNFPTDFSTDDLDINLPELWRLECAPSLLTHLFAEEGRVKTPKLNSVAITQYGLDLPILAECIPKAREVIKRRTTPGNDCHLFLAIRLTEVQIQVGVTPALREGILPKIRSKSGFDVSKGFEGVSPLEVSLPGTREEIRLGIYDSEIMGLLTLFPDVKSLILSSTEWYLRRPALSLERAQIKKFRKRSPALHTLVAY